jgi:cytochrome c-type biogenesis protein CcmH
MSSGRKLPWSASALAGVLLVAAGALAVVALRGPSTPRTMTDRVRAVASSLRCPVCQNLSVADSPSRLAQQMRATIAQELGAGRTAQQIRSEFSASYGEWILLAPPKRGISLIAWLAPLFLVVGALGVGIIAVRRWTAGRTVGSERDTVDAERALSLTTADRRLLERSLQASVEDTE